MRINIIITTTSTSFYLSYSVLITIIPTLLLILSQATNVQSKSLYNNIQNLRGSNKATYSNQLLLYHLIHTKLNIAMYLFWMVTNNDFGWGPPLQEILCLCFQSGISQFIRRSSIRLYSLRNAAKSWVSFCNFFKELAD